MILVYLLAAIAVAGALVLGSRYFGSTSRMTSITVGRVVSSAERVIVDSDERRIETEVVARYTASGQEFEIRRVLPGPFTSRYPVGATISVRYNPSEPHLSQFVST